MANLKIELQNRLEQRLIMTPQLQQAIKLLQLSQLELSEMLEIQMHENPFLEVAEDDSKSPDSIEDNEDRGESPDEAAVAGPEVDVPGESTIKEEDVGDYGGVDDMDRLYGSQEWEDYLNENYHGERGSFDSGAEVPNFESYTAGETSLQDHLAWQVRMINLSKRELAIALFLIGNINDEGYLDVSEEEAFDKLSTKIDELTPFEIEDMVWLLQTLDPPGVAARNLRECLLNQIRMLKLPNNNAERLLEEAFDKVEKQDYKAAGRQLGLTTEEVQETMRFISNLDPKPGRAFSGGESNYIIPDIYVYKIGDKHHIVLNDDGMPRLKISNLYRSVLRGDQKISSEEKEFLQDKMRSAAWLIKSIHQRQRTIYRVAESIVEYQQEFLDKGVSHLKPMILKDIAEMVGIHESTACRVCTNKYIHTPQGIFELRYFLNSSISRDEGDDMASEAVKSKIRDMVAEENPKKPLSDQAMVDALQEEGINIARRTVSKYREAMGILSSSKRKKRF